MKQRIFDHIKNHRGWTTSRKLILFSVDDYGSVRLHSAQALTNLTEAGITPHKRFDQLDSLENRTLGLTALKCLLHRIVARWSEVEFVSAGELAKMRASENE